MQTDTPINTVIVGDLDLAAIRSELEQQRDSVIGHEERFKENTLPIYLRMGLQCLKARSVFLAVVSNPQGRNQHTKEVESQRDSTSDDSQNEPPTSFSSWLENEVPWLVKPTAYKYLRAAEGLGMTPESTDRDLEVALKAARKALPDGKKLTLTLLANKANEPELVSEESRPPTKEELEAEARSQAHAWITSWDKRVKAGDIEHADVETLKTLDEFLTNTREHIRKRIKSATA